MTLHKQLSMRDAQRSLVNRLLEKIEVAKSETSLLEFGTILEKLESKAKTLEVLNEKILTQTDAENYEEEILSTEDYSLDLEIQLRRLRAYRDQQCTEASTQPAILETIPQIPTDNSAPALVIPNAPVETQQNGQSIFFHPQTVSNTSFSTNSSHFHRLPKLALPTFDGDILKWQTFWDSFEATVHLNVNLTDVQRFSYLKAQLVSDAARTIDGFALTNANYARALELLKSRYGQTHKIIHATMQALLQISPPTNSQQSLRHFYDKMETYIRGLESIGQYQDTYGSLLVPIVLDKLPSEIRRNIARDHGNVSWNLDDLRKAIGREIDILEEGTCSSVVESDPHMTVSFFTGTTKKEKNQNTGTQQTQRPQVKCAFCDMPHKAIECPQYTESAARKEVVKTKKLCFNCLGKHQVVNCRSRRRCQKCGKKHHTSICLSNNTTLQPNIQIPEVNRTGTAVLHSTINHLPSAVLLKTAISTVCSNEISTDAAILLDEGSHRSFITEELAGILKLPRTGRETINLSTFGGRCDSVMNIETATVNIVTENNTKVPINVLIVPTITRAVKNLQTPELANLPHLRGLKLAHPVSDIDSFTISLLVGADHYWDIVEDHVIRGRGPTAVKSKLGYLLSGPVSGTTQKEVNSLNVMISSTPISADLERFWNLESIGIKADDNNDRTPDATLLQYQESCIEYTGGKYTAKLPWKKDHQPLPTNFDVTYRRTKSTINRLRTEPDMLRCYSEIIAEQERKGFIERISEESGIKGHYIPHHPVRKESSTTPIRIVYDCSCRQSRNLPSLNDCLESTPPMLNDITTLLVRFRLHQYAVTTDIEKAFLHVGLHENDRDYTRFLWLSDPGNPDSDLVTYRFRVVLFGATCSPYMLNATILKHLHLNSETKAAKIIERDLYVDNVVSSFSDQLEAENYFKEARALMMSAGMNLRSWASNSPTLRKAAADDNVLDSDDVIKVLGLQWQPTSDKLSFNKREIPVVEKVTKRTVLKFASQIYDPLGLLCPVTVRAKILMQRLWTLKLDWDTPLPTDLEQTWNSLVSDLNTVADFEFDRKFLQGTPNTNFDTDDESTHLHVFVDASTQSYGAAAYICNNTEAKLVMARNRVAPLKKLTLPQLELMAALIGARLATHLQNILKAKHTTFWSDSQIVLHWLTTTKPLKRFVSNRVAEIKALTDVTHWVYCPTRDNPADLLTRGITAKSFQNNRLWFNGPAWICDKRKWPIWEGNQLVLKTIVEETKLNCNSSVDSSTCEIVPVVDFTRYSTFRRIQRVIAYVLRFISNCKLQRQERKTDHLSARELAQAEKVIILICQDTAFREVKSDLKKNRKSHPLIRQLRLYLDSDGLIRCGGRIHNAPVDTDTKFPILLPKKHLLTRMIVQDAHHRSKHSGVNYTTTLVRQKYWIPAIRQCIQSVARKCVTCRKVNGRPYSTPDPPPLPATRLMEAPPFSVTGIDFTGALYIRQPDGREDKAYICLFTCASTRAIHLEVVTSLSEEAFIRAFRRFASRKSVPKTVISDNAATFQAAAIQLEKMFKSELVTSTFSNMGVEWQFIPKRAPWYGGFWERLVGVTKTALRKTLGRAFVDLDTLQTAVTEIEALINDRPLTYVSSSFEDMQPLTPSHLLYGRRLTSLPHGYVTEVNNVTSSRADMHNRAKKLQSIIEQYWRRWKSEYLTSLREFHRISGKTPQTITPGDVVQVHDDKPRSTWKLAVVEETLPGRDGLIRAARIRTENGQQTTRPIVKLFPLELLSDT